MNEVQLWNILVDTFFTHQPSDTLSLFTQVHLRVLPPFFALKEKSTRQVLLLQTWFRNS